MWPAVLLLATANEEFCNKVNNFKPVRVCSQYTDDKNLDECKNYWNSASSIVLQGWQTINQTETTGEFLGCRARCPHDTVNECFELMKQFTNALDANSNIMGFTSSEEDDDTRHIAFFTETACASTVTYSVAQLKQACLQGFRSHHGIEPPENTRRFRRQEQRQRFNNRFDVIEDAEEAAMSVVTIVAVVLGVLALIGIGIFLYNRHSPTATYSTGENGIKISGLI